MKKRDKQKTKANKSQNELEHKSYKRLRNQVVNEVKKDKRKWLVDQMNLDIHTGKQLWQAVQKLSGKASHQPIQSLTTQGKEVTDSKEMAEALNTNFQQKVKNIKKALKKPATPYLELLKTTRA